MPEYAHNSAPEVAAGPFTADLKQISVPVLVMHGDDQIVPYADSGPPSAKLVKNGTLKTYHGFPHGMPATEAATTTRASGVMTELTGSVTVCHYHPVMSDMGREGRE